jgi:hypothetical protein
MHCEFKELVEQSKNIVRLTIPNSGEKFRQGIFATHDFDLEKYSELIVLECAKIIESQDVDPSFKLRMSTAIKQHFGI